jgi:hypothetical protein
MNEQAGKDVPWSERERAWSDWSDKLLDTPNGNLTDDDQRKGIEELLRIGADPNKRKVRHLNDDDIFSLIPDRVATLIAGICGKMGTGTCTCIEIGNIVRREQGNPQFAVKENKKSLAFAIQQLTLLGAIEKAVVQARVSAEIERDDIQAEEADG